MKTWAKINFVAVCLVLLGGCASRFQHKINKRVSIQHAKIMHIQQVLEYYIEQELEGR